MRKKLMVIAMCLAAVLGAARLVRGQSNQEGRIIALENAWEQAESKADTKALQQMLAQTFVYTDEDGNFMDKGKYLASLKKTTNDSTQQGNRSLTVFFYGDTAVVAGLYKERGMKNSKAFVKMGRFTDTWVNINGSWQCVASQLTIVKKQAGGGNHGAQ
jgi:ketosteroid isomerase-like protein